jgi:hypothetical protein
MKTFEYTVIQNMYNTEGTIKTLNKLGREGWELVSEYKVPRMHNDEEFMVSHFVFKRSIGEEDVSVSGSVSVSGIDFSGVVLVNGRPTNVVVK